MQHPKPAARLVVALIAISTLGSAPLLVSAGVTAGDFRVVGAGRLPRAATAQSPVSSFLGFAPGEQEYVLLTPAGSFGTLGPLVQGRVGGIAVSTGDDLDSRAAMSPRVNSWVETLQYVDRVPIEVGRRTLDAWVFTGMAALDNIYVDDDGVVLRVDLARHFWEQLGVAGLNLGLDPEQADFRRLHVRLLFPSEY